MTDHVCCDHAREHLDDAGQDWAALAKFERQVLALANGLRGLERTLNRRPHAGRQVNAVDAAVNSGAMRQPDADRQLPEPTIEDPLGAFRPFFPDTGIQTTHWGDGIDCCGQLHESDEEIDRRIRASIDQDLADPEWRASMERSLADANAGRVIPWRVALLPLPRWAFWLLYRVAPFTWGRKSRRMPAPESAPTRRES